MSDSIIRACSDCEGALDRRAFLRTVGASSLIGASLATLGNMPTLFAAPTPASAAETAVGRFYQSLSETQKKTIAFPFDHELRNRISANWHVTKPVIRDEFYSDEQRKMIDEIIRKITTADGYERFEDQTEYDDGGFGGYSVAVFGTPGSGKFEWELTGRHLTLRADGDSVDQMAFGGPIIYGHGESDPEKNLFHYQTKEVNKVFQALDPKQVEKALISKAPRESAVELQGASKSYPGISVAELSSDQKGLVEQTLKTLLAPYRTEDVDEVFAILKSTGGVDQLSLAFYQQEDLNEDKLWDIWRVEGPSLVWHFRGAPHVHAYINIGVKA